MTAFQQRDTARGGMWRLLLWGSLGLLLLCPLAAMRFTDEVRWDLADFAAAAALLTVFGGAVELAMHLSRTMRTRATAIGAALAVVMLVWADAAVGLF